MVYEWRRLLWATEVKQSGCFNPKFWHSFLWSAHDFQMLRRVWSVKCGFNCRKWPKHSKLLAWPFLFIYLNVCCGSPFSLANLQRLTDISLFTWESILEKLKRAKLRNKEMFLRFFKMVWPVFSAPCVSLQFPYFLPPFLMPGSRPHWIHGMVWKVLLTGLKS